MSRLRVMTFNVWFGGGERLPAILEVIRREQPDLLVLQECLGWEDGSALASVAGALGLPATPEHVHLGNARPRPSGARYHVAIVSRRPIRSARDHNDPHFLGHCVVELATSFAGQPLTVFGTHFDASHERLRFVEARWLRSLLDPGSFAEGLFILAGDLNSLSPEDPYPPGFEAQLRAAGVSKYGLPPRFEVLEELLEFGWVDTLHRAGAPRSWITARRQNNGVAFETRTDYVLASPRLAPALTGAEVVDVQEASDHHAVLATFEL